MQNPFDILQEESPAGISSFAFLPIAQISTFPQPIEGLIDPNQIQLAPGASWLKGYAYDDTFQYEETIEHTANGPLYKKTFSGIFPFLQGSVHHRLYVMNNLEFALVLKRPDSQIIYLGSINEPVLFQYNTHTQTPGKLPGHSFKFFGYHANPSPFSS